MRTIATLVITLAVLTGCSAGGGAPAEGTARGDGASVARPSGSASSDPSPSAASPPASGLDVAPPGETAEQFLRRWVALGTAMQQTGETAAFLSVAGPDCTSCREFADRVHGIYAAGGRIRGGRETVTRLRAEGPTQWLVTTKAEPTVYQASSGAGEETLAGGSSTSRVYLAEVDGRWIVGYTEGIR